MHNTLQAMDSYGLLIDIEKNPEYGVLVKDLSDVHDLRLLS